jgi:hypothetical protein
MHTVEQIITTNYIHVVSVKRISDFINAHRNTYLFTQHSITGTLAQNITFRNHMKSVLQ